MNLHNICLLWCEIVFSREFYKTFGASLKHSWLKIPPTMFKPRNVCILFKVMVCFVYLLGANSWGKAEELQIMIFLTLFYSFLAFLPVPLFMIDRQNKLNTSEQAEILLAAAWLWAYGRRKIWWLGRGNAPCHTVGTNVVLLQPLCKAKLQNIATSLNIAWTKQLTVHLPLHFNKKPQRDRLGLNQAFEQDECRWQTSTMDKTRGWTVPWNATH